MCVRSTCLNRGTARSRSASPVTIALIRYRALNDGQTTDRKADVAVGILCFQKPCIKCCYVIHASCLVPRPIPQNKNRTIGAPEYITGVRPDSFRDEIRVVRTDNDQLIDVCALRQHIGYVF